MRIDIKKLDMELARQCKPMSSLRGVGISPSTLRGIRNGASVKPVTLGKIAKALGIDPVEIIEKED